MSIRAKILSFFIRRTMKKQFATVEDVPAFRERMKNSGRMMTATPDSVSVTALSVNGVPCEWVSSGATDEKRVLMYLHGGGYMFGGLDSHRDIAWRLAEGSGMRVLMVDYRLAPEHPFPAAVEDATGCYRWLIDEGYDPKQMAIGGDSAGGGLAIATLVNARNLGLAMPAACILLSPWTDLSISGDSVAINEAADPMLSRAALDRMAELYLGNRDRRAPLASPLLADLRELPPALIQVGSTEVLLSDSERLAVNLREAGGEAAIEVWPKMPHVFPMFASRIPEGKQAVANLAEFLRKHTG